MEPIFDLTNRVAIVTGSSQGIGRACAERLCQHGARVVFSRRTWADCDARAAETNHRWGEERATADACDISDAVQVRDLVTRSAEHWGRLDIVVGNARVATPGTSWVDKTDPDELSRSLVGSVSNNLVLAQAAVPFLRRQGEGSIIYIASTAGIAALEEHLAYGVAKAALIHLARILAVQLGPSNIRVNRVSPGLSRPPEWARRNGRTASASASSPATPRSGDPGCPTRSRPASCGWRRLWRRLPLDPTSSSTAARP